MAQSLAPTVAQSVEPSTYVLRKGDNLTLTLPVTFPEAALGDPRLTDDRARCDVIRPAMEALLVELECLSDIVEHA